ncbi:hypothetical protein Tco_0315535 [Tanacetum coccineum]
MRRIHFHRIRRIQLSVQYSVFIRLIIMAYPLPLDTAYQSSGTEFLEVLIRASRLKKIPYEVMTELISEEYIVNAQNKSSLSITSNNINIQLSKEFFVELHKNPYHGWIEEDVMDNIDMVLKMIDFDLHSWCGFPSTTNENLSSLIG